jgi:hypothetical protein
MEQARRGIHGDLWSREGAKILHPTPPSRELPHPFPLFPPEGGQHADPILLPPREFLSIFFLQEKCLVSLQAQPPSHSSSSFRCSPPPLALFFFLQAHLPSPSYYAEDGGGHLGEETEACCLNGALQR